MSRFCVAVAIGLAAVLTLPSGTAAEPDRATWAAMLAGLPTPSKWCSEGEPAEPARCSEENQEYLEHGSAVTAAFGIQDFSTLERQYQAWCRGEERQQDGSWRLLSFEVGLQWHFRLASSRVEQHLAAWAKANKAGEARVLAEMLWLIWRAEQLRAPASLALAERARKRRASLLQRARRIGERLVQVSTCPLPALAQLQAVSSLWLDRQIDMASYRRLMARALRRFPTFAPFHRQAAQVAYLRALEGPGFRSDPAVSERRRHPTRQAAAAFDERARALMARDDNPEGAGRYARIYRERRVAGVRVEPALRDLTPDWRLLSAGFEALLSRYPTSRSLLSDYASAACQYGTDSSYLKLRAQLGSDIRWAEWPVDVAACDLKHGPAPLPAVAR